MCVDSLLKLIDTRVQNAITASSHINSEIAQVISMNGTTTTVKLLSNGTEYTLPNYSGSEVRVGDVVYVYWKGGFLSARSAYIGASARANFPTAYIYGVNSTGSISSVSTQIEFESLVNDCTVNLVFNAIISATAAGNYALTIYVDNTAETYVPTGTTIANGYVSCNFILPLSLSSVGNHTILISGSGNGAITQMKSYIFGQGIKEGGTNG
jgi:hypothetical protein